MWDLTIHPLKGLASSLAHCLVSSFDTICNSQSLLLTDIVGVLVSYVSSSTSWLKTLILEHLIYLQPHD